MIRITAKLFSGCKHKWSRTTRLHHTLNKVRYRFHSGRCFIPYLHLKTVKRLCQEFRRIESSDQLQRQSVGWRTCDNQSGPDFCLQQPLVAALNIVIVFETKMWNSNQPCFVSNSKSFPSWMKLFKSVGALLSVREPLRHCFQLGVPVY